MGTTLAILLYLHSICACTYTQQEIDQVIQQNETKITEIQSDPSLTAKIEIDYQLEVANIVIIDPDE